MWVQRVGLEPGFNPKEAADFKKGTADFKKGTGIHTLGNQGPMVRIPAWSPKQEAGGVGHEGGNSAKVNLERNLIFF